MTDVKVICRDDRHVNGKEVNLGLLRPAKRTALSRAAQSERLEQAVALLRAEAELTSSAFDEPLARRRAEGWVLRAEATETQMGYVPRSSRLLPTGRGWRTAQRTGVWAEVSASGVRVWYLCCPVCHREARVADEQLTAIVAQHAETAAPLDISGLSD